MNKSGMSLCAVLWSCRVWAEGRSQDGWGWAASGVCDCGYCAAWTSARSSPDVQCCWETWDTTDASHTHTHTHTAHDQICVRSLYFSCTSPSSSCTPPCPALTQASCEPREPPNPPIRPSDTCTRHSIRYIQTNQASFLYGKHLLTFVRRDWCRAAVWSLLMDSRRLWKQVRDQLECTAPRVGSETHAARWAGKPGDQLWSLQVLQVFSAEQTAKNWKIISVTSFPSCVTVFPAFRASIMGPMAAVPLQVKQKTEVML